MYDLGSRLKEMRIKRGLTQAMLAKRINKSVPAISGYETNTQTPPMEVLLSISEALHVPITYFTDLNCEETYSTNGFSAEQKELLDLIFEELTTPTGTGEALSPRQMEITRKMMVIFSKK